jgi:hypothetical protein
MEGESMATRRQFKLNLMEKGLVHKEVDVVPAAIELHDVGGQRPRVQRNESGTCKASPKVGQLVGDVSSRNDQNG